MTRRVVLVLALALAAPRALAQDAPRLRVLVASSLTEVAGELAASFEGARVEPSFGASSALARQVRDGAPADVFVSASADWIEFLDEAGALAGEPIVLARNRLVCIAAGGAALAARDPAALLGELGAQARVAIADRGVPAGEYARAALRSLGILDAYRPHLVGQKDVRAVLHTVERGELEAGFAYATDAKLAGVRVLFAFDRGAHAPLEYRAAVLRDASHPRVAQRFLAYLQSQAARALLARAGFALP